MAVRLLIIEAYKHLNLALVSYNFIDLSGSIGVRNATFADKVQFFPKDSSMDQSNNNVKKMREARMLSKAELARMAGISPLTLDRIEKGKDCRMATKRKILLALDLSIEQKNTVFKQ